MPFRLFPENASANGSEIDWIFWALTALSAFILVLVFVPIAYFAVKYRKGSPADRTLAKMSTFKFEITWTIIPLIIGLGIFAWAAEVFYRVETPPANALHVFVVGKQWMWKLQHAEGNREINELHVPVGRAVVLTMTSQDVIHDFFVPDFRAKQDVVPGRYTTEWFTPTKVGRYRIFCAQYCGTSHASMVGWVDVMEPADYDNWLATTGQGETMAAEGARLFVTAGCSGCHGVSSKIHAPKLEGIYGHPVPLNTGQ
ncbi:MAG TPA: cytochrome c oxidase subunit II, partial [Chthoniobacteraceae bacterium]|nr:cytochrome c oxidase subunit II [Chthoniobacteraceae bacterium]